MHGTDPVVMKKAIRTYGIIGGLLLVIEMVALGNGLGMRLWYLDRYRKQGGGHRLGS